MSPHVKGKRQEEDPALGLQLTLITVDSVLRRVKSGEVWGNGFLYVEIQNSEACRWYLIHN